MTAPASQRRLLGRSVGRDSVGKTKSIRATWLALAAEQGVTVRVVHCVLSDQAAHRQRVEERRRGIPGWPELSWADVERVGADFETWSEEHLVLDAARPLMENAKSLAVYLASGTASAGRP